MGYIVLKSLMVCSSSWWWIMAILIMMTILKIAMFCGTAPNSHRHARLLFLLLFLPVLLYSPASAAPHTVGL